MPLKFVKSNRIRRSLFGALLLAVLLTVSGCRTISFYSQALKGQYQIFAHEQPVDKLLSDPKTSATLKERLELVQELRSFAGNELKLPVDGHYLKYVDVHRPYVVWNVESAPEFSLQSRTWWYPLVGSLQYRGYFSQSAATNYAAYLRRKGEDAYVGGVPAYSTLGWFKDPLLNTFIFEEDSDLAETIFHELGHQRVFARGDTDFNEAFATTVGQEGARRWLKSKHNDAKYGDYLASIRRTWQFVHLIARTRMQLASLFGDEETEDGKLKSTRKNSGIPPDQLRRQKREIYAAMQNNYAKLKLEWNGNTEYDGWFAREVNNAKLNSVAAYFDLVPGFEHLLELNGGDLEKFYQESERLSKMPKKQREQTVRTLGVKPPAP